MTPIIIDNTVRLKDDKFDWIEVNVRVPEKNIQNMLDLTGGQLLSKKPISVTFNHYAGQLYLCRVRCPLKKVKNRLKRGSLFDEVGNKKEFLSLFDDKHFLGYFTTNPLSNEITGLYEFGNCRNYRQNQQTTVYFYKNGRAIELNNNERTKNGKKRYVRNNNKWASNRKF